MRRKLSKLDRAFRYYHTPDFINYFTKDARLLYRNTPNKTFQALLYMARRPVGAWTFPARKWNVSRNFKPVYNQFQTSLIPHQLKEKGLAVPIYKNQQLTHGYLLNAKGLSVLREIGFRDEIHGGYVDAYIPTQVEHEALLLKWTRLSDFNRSSLNPENKQFDTDIPF
jgi:hypothetical protein